MAGRPGHRTMEMNGRSTVSYLVRTPRVPFFMLIVIGLEAKNRLAFQGRAGIASIVRWSLRPIIFGVDLLSIKGAMPTYLNLLRINQVMFSSLVGKIERA